MAAVAHYSSTATDISMDGFPSGQQLPLDISDYIFFDETPMPTLSVQLPTEGLVLPPSASNVDNGNCGGSSSSTRRVSERLCAFSSKCRSTASERRTGEEGSRVAFRTKSEVEIMDDGFKWRKYGRKSVKNSPNPRNYYRCSAEGCSVKKRVEREPEDPSYVITTYDGTHNHTSPDVVYYATQDSESGRFVVSGFHQIPPSS